MSDEGLFGPDCCIICGEKVDQHDPANHKCILCTKRKFCLDCLKNWFIAACKDETKMPPACCRTTIPVSIVSGLLTPAQVNTLDMHIYR